MLDKKMSNKKKDKFVSGKNIVLDLDSTLICSFLDTDHVMRTMKCKYGEKLNSLVNSGQISQITVPNFGGSGTSTVYHVVKRPGLTKFLNFCSQNFDNVIVWSAGHPRYVNEIVRILDKDETIFTSIYTSNHTVMYVRDRYKNSMVPLEPGISMQSCPDIVYSSKPLKKITIDHPEVTLNNTVIVDDLSCNFGLDNPKNGILIPSFKPTVEDLLFESEKKLQVIGNDLTLFKLIHYFSDDAFSCIENVRNYDLKFFKERSSGFSCRSFDMETLSLAD